MIIKNVLGMCFTNVHTTPKTCFLSCVYTPGSILCIYRPLASLKQSLIFIIIGAGAIELPPCSPFASYWIRSEG